MLAATIKKDLMVRSERVALASRTMLMDRAGVHPSRRPLRGLLRMRVVRGQEFS